MFFKMNTSSVHLRAMFFRYKKSKDVSDEEIDNMSYNAAKEYKILLINNIIFQRYSGLYPDLSPVYAKWKKEQGGAEGFWKLWGSLINAISLRETPKGFSVGVERDVMPIKTSSMGKKKKITPVWMYAWYGEHSYQHSGMFKGIQPARPLFKPTQEEFKLIFKEKRAKDAWSKIRNSW